MGLEGVLQLAQMGNDDDLGEVVPDGLDDLHQAFEALGILGAEPLVDDQGAQAGAGAPGQHAGQGDAQGEIDAKRLAAGEQLVVAGAQVVADLDVERFGDAAGAGVALRFQRHVHGVVADPREDTVGLFLQLGDGVFDHDGLDAVLAEHAGEVVVELPFGHRVLPLLLLRLQFGLLLQARLMLRLAAAQGEAGFPLPFPQRAHQALGGGGIGAHRVEGLYFVLDLLAFFFQCRDFRVSASLCGFEALKGGARLGQVLAGGFELRVPAFDVLLFLQSAAQQAVLFGLVIQALEAFGNFLEFPLLGEGEPA